MKLLIVEDNEELQQDIASFLEESGFVCESALNLSEAFEKTALYNYDVVIVDLGLPDGSGLEIVKNIKQSDADTGILILTARDKIEDKVDGLNLGADDYMTKPFHKAELNARLNSIIRRKKFDGKTNLTFGIIEVDLSALEVKIDSKPVSLTKKEYDLLLYFLYNQNRVLTKESIAEYLWGDHSDQSDNFDFIYNHIKNLRKKISNASGNNYIKAMYGLGYKFSLSENDLET